MARKHPPVPGVYAIWHKATGRIYIGSSKDVSGRLCAHRTALRSLSHPNEALQRDWLIYGEDAFSSAVLMQVAPCSDPLTFKKHLVAAERSWMLFYPVAEQYNCRPASSYGIDLAIDRIYERQRQFYRDCRTAAQAA